MNNAPVGKSVRNIGLMLALSITLCVLLLLAGLLASGVRIDTNLKGLSPALSDDPVVSATLDALTQSAESRVMLVFVSPTAAQAENAAESFSRLLRSGAAGFGADDGEAILSVYTELLRDYQFHLLREEQITRLSNMHARDFLALAQRRRHGLDSWLGLLPLRDDPFGLANAFAAEVASTFAGKFDGAAIAIGESEEQAPSRYAVPLLFRVSEQAFDMRAQHALTEQLAALENMLSRTYPATEIWRSGIVFFASKAAADARADVSLITVGSSLGVLLLVLLVFRSPRPVLLVVVSVGIGVGFAFCLVHLLYSSVHVLTIVFGASLIGVVVDYALHFLYVYDERAGSERRVRLFRAMALSLATSVVGYAALSFAGLQMLQQVAVFSIFGLVSAWCLVVGFGPMISQKSLPRRDGPLLLLSRRLLRGVEAFGGRQRGVALLIISVVFSVLAYKGIAVNDTHSAFFSMSSTLLEQERKINTVVAGYEPASYVLVSADSPALVYQRIDSLEAALGEKQPHTLLGIHRLLPSITQQGQAYAAYAAIYGGDSGAMSVLSVAGLGEAARADLQERYKRAAGSELTPLKLMQRMGGLVPPWWLEHENVYYAVLMLPRTMNLEALAERVREQPGVRLVRVAWESRRSVQALRISASAMLLVALLLVAMMMCLRYRALAGALLAVVPAASVMMTVIVLQLLQIPVSLFHVMALFLVIGLGMDYVIFATELGGKDAHAMVAVLLSAMTSILSFGLLSLSSLPVMSAFGVTVLVGNSCNLLGAFMVSNSFKQICR